MPIDTAKLQADVHRRILPRPASPTSSPLLDRAVEELRKAYPADMAGVDIQDMPWNNELAGTNVLGETSPDNQIRMNPVLGAAFPQRAAEGVLAHELQHVRQNKASSDPRLDMLRELNTEYSNRPSEIEAGAAAAQYDETHPGPQTYRMTPPITSQAFPSPVRR